ncbi:L-ascorbate metabolism protein UlaG, beta-lactamase superfamily [Geosmithia morbida]|uniref:L-ascorbate metabolism protein UlaG, beta-lactamase superfamily n=1 Tax=Geosmithia morbida TaxID=1094350 RepID=A0A9P5D3T6_9HYPO|nr:L-ascorbate metabolism protein UlaG, beta-lactamase superfamily [Geosmithia morbida]KAF4122120.1 L-ascorbate metabolism protein UlaG, beta-lactamase superfamily [Geosmithia morbida]
MSSSSHHYSTQVRKTEGRTNLPKEAESNPHHVKKGGKVVGFRNPYPSFADIQVFSAILWPYITGRMRYPDTANHGISVVEPKWSPSRFSQQTNGNIRATWLGHASYYVEFPSGLRVLTDPVFEERCAPRIATTFGLGPKRYTRAPCSVQDIPIVDVVLISHNHYDHLSNPTIAEVRRYHPDAHYFVSRGLATWFHSHGITKVTELDWWEDAELSVTVKDDAGQPTTMTATLSCLPAQHSSARTLWDRDATLWSSWAVRSSGRSLWFAGDTGYARTYKVKGETTIPTDPNPQFRQIGEHRGPFDLGLIPIGAYDPRDAFSSVHTDPFGSVEIFRETRCRRAMAIHWGTWTLTSEHVLEPPMLLKEALRRRQIPEEGVFDVCDIGEAREFPGGDDTDESEE